ncbi:MAG: threonine synthase, partial [Butyrivibrio sp.]|nr:threonine synthase [Butyrivibrio sp.]
LFDFFKTGEYDRNREFVLTSSPSMDILISSNLERLIYHIAGNSAEADAKYMKELSTDGKYEITPAMKEELKDFYGGYATEDETFKTIADLFNNASYLIDTHTAVAAAVYDKYKKETGDKTATVIASTASPYKFTRSVMNALGKGDDSKDDFALADELSTLSGVAIPEAVTSIRNAEIRHKTVVEKTEMESAVKSFLGI